MLEQCNPADKLCWSLVREFLKEKLSDRALFDAVDAAMERDQPSQILHLGKRDVISQLKLSKPLVEWNKRDPSSAAKPSTLLGLLVDMLTRPRQARPKSPVKSRENDSSSPSPYSPTPIMAEKSLVPEEKLEVRAVTPIERDGMRSLLLRGMSSLPAAWGQGFFFTQAAQCPYGLEQVDGGPCGVLAAVNAHLVRPLLGQADNFLDFCNQRRFGALRRAFIDILWRVGQEKQCCLCTYQPGEIKDEAKSLPLLKLNGMKVVTFHSRASLEDYFLDRSIMAMFTRPDRGGVILFLCSVIMSRTVDGLLGDFDHSESSLIGRHGYCTQELVNLLLTGKATSNCFDGDKTVGGVVCKGITAKAEIGFLSHLECTDCVEVGAFLKEPRSPVWIIQAESHYSFVFFRGRDLIYYDQFGKQDEEYRLTIDLDTRFDSKNPPPGHIDGMIDQTLRTKFKDATINWNGSDPIL